MGSLVAILAFIMILFFLRTLKKNYKKSFNFRVLTALLIGITFGLIVRVVFDAAAIESLDKFMYIFSGGYIALLKMVVIPLILVAMTTSIMHSESGGNIARVAPKVIMVLVGTVAIAAFVGVISTYIFSIDGAALVSSVGSSQAVADQAATITEKSETLTSMTYSEYIVSIIPTNIFEMLTGSSATAALSTVLFSMFLGYCIMQVNKRKPEKARPFMDFMDSSKEIVLSMVKEILKLTPYAIIAMMASFIITADVDAIGQLIRFLAASYFAIMVMFIVHFLIIALLRLNPITFAKKIFPVILFGFGSRSSMAALPMNIAAQIKELGVDEETASMSATFGTSIGQNGCAGIYPAMVAIMAAQYMGIQIDLTFIITLIIVVTISSFGIAGVGGGATFAAITVLTIMGLDITVAAILVSIEPLIDMARTALNISDSMLSGVVTSRLNKTIDEDVYNA